MKQTNLSVVTSILKAHNGQATTKQLLAEIQSKIDVSTNYARVLMSQANKSIGASPRAVKRAVAVKAAAEVRVLQDSNDKAFEAAKADGIQLTKEEFVRQRAIFSNMFQGLV